MLDKLFALALFVHGPSVALPHIPRVLFVPLLDDSSKGLFGVVNSIEDRISVAVNRVPYVNVQVVHKNIELDLHVVFFLDGKSTRSTAIVLTNVENYKGILEQDSSVVVVSYRVPSTATAHFSVQRLCSRTNGYTVNYTDRAIQAAALRKQIVKDV